MMQPDYYSVLARVIGATLQDEAQLRRTIYELARLKLRRQLLFRAQHGGRAEIEQQILELEIAVEQIELDVAQNSPLLTYSAEAAPNETSDDAPTRTDLVVHRPASAAAVLETHLAEVLGPITYSPVQRMEVSRPLPAMSELEGEFTPVRPLRASRPQLWFRLQLALAVVLGIAIYLAIEGRSSVLSLTNWHLVYGTPQLPTKIEEKTPPLVIAAPAVRPPIANTPVPTSYGVYAADGGKLIELEPLPIRVPDPRVSISGAISTPSQTTLPDGKLQFLVFRRDLINNAPETIMVRVVAQVVRALSFTGGTATVRKIDGTWAVRGMSYAMKVAPVAGNPEMIVIRPQTDDFVFPAGRYALVLKALAYDFTVAGPLTDPAHCLERTEAVGEPVYSECRSP